MAGDAEVFGGCGAVEVVFAEGQEDGVMFYRTLPSRAAGLERGRVRSTSRSALAGRTAPGETTTSIDCRCCGWSATQPRSGGDVRMRPSFLWPSPAA